MHHPDRGDPVAAWQSGRRRTVFELAIEHSVWTTRHSESVGEDHDRRGSSVYVDCVGARFTDLHWFAISVAVGARERTNSDSDAGATSNARSASAITGSTRGITRSESVGYGV